jgi:cysteine desulfurase
MKIDDRICIKSHELLQPIIRPIYMDYQATTPMDPRVLGAIIPYFTEFFGNPHSRTHAYGWEAESAVEEARVKVANLINAQPSEIIFTSGATESNNIAIKGVARFYKNQGKNHIITTAIEHKCVLDSCRHLEQEGFEITYLHVDSDGLISLEELRNAITERTSIVSIIALNNEIGVIQDLYAIGETCRSRGVFFHTDAAQAFGKIPLDVRNMQIDLMSISGHKIYGPKGIGALFVGKKPRVRLQPIFSGGGQERSMRSGTVPTPLVVGLGVASEIAQLEMQQDLEHVNKLANMFIDQIMQLEHIYLNGSKTARYMGCINISFACIEGESMIGAIKNIAVSSGSACTSSSLEGSYVLRALGVDEELAHTSIRFGIGRFTKEEDIEIAIQSVKNAVQKLRDLSPLWDMLLAGVDLKSIQWDEGH